MESAQVIKHQQHVVPLSEQHLIDCLMPNDSGCWPTNLNEIMNYLLRNHKSSTHN